MSKESHMVSPELWEELLKNGWNKEIILERAISTEILEELPHIINKEFILRIWKNENGYFIDYFNAYTEKPYLMELPLSLQSGIKLSDTLARMYIYLTQQKII